MSSAHISLALRRLVEERAAFRCEYCLLPASVAFLRPREADHIVAEKHGGATEAENLALACWRGNRHKGTDLASLDPATGDLTRLFNPRTQVWHVHVRLEGAQLDTPERTIERQRLISLGHYPQTP